MTKIISVVRGIDGTHLVREPETLTVWEIYHALEPDGLRNLIGFYWIIIIAVMSKMDAF